MVIAGALPPGHVGRGRPRLRALPRSSTSLKPFPAGLIDGQRARAASASSATTWSPASTRASSGRLVAEVPVTLRAAILSTGDELTTGRIVDTNASWIADKLFELGVDVVAVLTVGDYPERLAWAWRQALAQADVVISTGGIGPTADDLTTETVAARARRAARRGRRRRRSASGGFFAAARRRDAGEQPEAGAHPRRARPSCRTRSAPRPATASRTGGTHLVVLPGVPREMKPMVEDTVLPWLRRLRGGPGLPGAHVFQTFGITESGLDELVAGVVDPAEGRVSFRASFPEVSLRVVVARRARRRPRRGSSVLAARLRERLGPFVYGEGAVTMEEVVGRALRREGLTLARRRVVHGRPHRPPRDQRARQLGVLPRRRRRVRERGEEASSSASSPETLDAHGAVSEETAGEMAAGVRRALGADVGGRRRRASRAPTAARRRSPSALSASGSATGRRHGHDEPPPALGHARLGEAPRLADRARHGAAPRPRAAGMGSGALPAALRRKAHLTSGGREH